MRIEDSEYEDDEVEKILSRDYDEIRDMDSRTYIIHKNGIPTIAISIFSIFLSIVTLFAQYNASSSKEECDEIGRFIERLENEAAKDLKLQQ